MEKSIATRKMVDVVVWRREEKKRKCRVQRRRGNENWEDGGMARKIGARGPWNTTKKRWREILLKAKGE